MIQKNVDLGKMTTMRIGGIADVLFTPESVDELEDALTQIGDNKYYIISGGSNLLINDEKRFLHVISMREIDKRIDNLGNGQFYIGASARIQKVIKEVNSQGYGGLEQLYSIPALLGGMVYMNAGVGRKKNEAIGDFIVSVDVLENHKVRTLTADECQFGYRKSIFQNNPRMVIIGATLQLYEIEIEEANKRIKERMSYVQNTQDHSGANFGTLCSKSDTRLIALSRLLHKGDMEGVHFSKKKPNCLINSGKGTYAQAIKLIHSVQRIHKFFHKPCELEVRIWE